MMTREAGQPLKPVIRKPEFRDLMEAHHVWEVNLGTTTVTAYGFNRICDRAVRLAEEKRLSLDRVRHLLRREL